MLRALITHAREAKMRISRAIGRVKRQAKQGMAGLGEGLQSAVVPRPLRGAARRLAELLGASKATARARKEPLRPHAAATSAAYQPQVASDTPDEVTFTGTDSGVEPNDEPRDDTPVDPSAVGATPTYDATPVEVAPLEVTPVDASPVDATPLEVTPLEITPIDLSPAVHDAPGDGKTRAETPEQKPSAASPGKAASRSSKKRPAPTHGGESTKEKLAASEEAAKTLARSGSGGSKKRSGARAGTSKKK